MLKQALKMLTRQIADARKSTLEEMKGRDILPHLAVQENQLLKVCCKVNEGLS